VFSFSDCHDSGYFTEAPSFGQYDSSYICDFNHGLLTILTLGCAKTPAVEGFCNGYNYAIDTYVRWWGFPKNSRKRWESILLNPDAYFDNRSRTEKPQTLLLSGAPASIHGTSLWLKEVINKDNKLLDYRLACEDKNLPCGIYDCMIWPMIPFNKSLEVFAGPEGSDFLVVRGFNQASNHPATLVFDLRYGGWIELEREPKVPFEETSELTLRTPKAAAAVIYPNAVSWERAHFRFPQSTQVQ
jgi:hypothetical protein